MLSQLSRSAAHCATRGGAQVPSTWGHVEAALRQWSATPCQPLAAGLAAAAAPPADDDGGERGVLRRRRRGALQQQAGEGGGGVAAAHRLARLVGRFKSRAHANDAAGAEYFFRLYVQEGGEPQHWMLPMLLGTYGRLRQADKAWAVYRRLLELEDGRRSGEAAALPSAAAERQRHAGAAGPAGSHPFEGLDSETEPGSGSSSAAQHTQRPQQREQLQQQPRGPGGVGAADWQARLAARRAAVSGEAGALVAGLRLDAAPLTQYTYSALLTALSRAEHPPYDLPPEYAARAADAFGEMRRRGVQPNLVLWHNLLDCQAKAGQVDAALSTYAAMRAAGQRPTTWTFSMLAAAAGRAGRPAVAAEVVERLMPQAGVRPNVAVWNAVLGAYGRAGSVDAAYAAWLAMLEAGAVPDDCTERVLALAFGSHPALAAEVVAEARQVRRQRSGQLAAAEAAGGGAGDCGAEAAEGPRPADGGGGGATGDGGGGDGTERYRRGPDRPYRLHHHRQPRLAVDSLAGGPDPLLKSAGRNGQPSLSFLKWAGESDVNSAAAAALDAASGGTPASQAALLRDALVLDLHGSSQAAARMVLLRRLEALVHLLPALEAVVAQQQQTQQHEETQQQQQQQQQQSTQQQQQQQGPGDDPLQQPVHHPSEAAWERSASFGGASAAATGHPPPGLVVITGLGRHSRGDGGGVLKAAVRALLRQQGLPTVDDPGNEGVVVVPWAPLLAYLQGQRSAMSTDRFLSAARMRYLYILSGVGGLLAAAHLLPRLAPWLA